MAEYGQPKHTGPGSWSDELLLLVIGGIAGAVLESVLQALPRIPLLVLLALLFVTWLLIRYRAQFRDTMRRYVQYIQWAVFLVFGFTVGVLLVSFTSPGPVTITPTPTLQPPCPSVPETLPVLAPITTDNVSELKELRQINISRVLDVALSGDGRWFAVATGQGVCLYEWETMRGSFGLFSPRVSVAAFSLDGSLLALGNQDGTVEVWDMRSSDMRVRWKISGHSAPVTSLVFSADGRWLASAGDDRSIKLWESLNGQPSYSLGEHTSTVRNLTFSLDGRLASGSSDGMVKLWDIHERRMMVANSDHKDSITALAFSPDGEWLASGGKDKTIHLWNTDNGTTRQLRGHSGWVNAVYFSPDGRLIASGGEDGTIRLWEADTGAQLLSLHGHTAGVYGVAFSPDGRVLLSGSGDGTVRFWGVGK